MLVVCTWNLEDFFRPGTGDGPTSQKAYELKLQDLAGTIKSINPDVLAVQEVGEPEALVDLTDRLGDGWHTITSEHPDGRGIRVGFVSTRPFTEVDHIVEFPAELEAIQQSDAGLAEHEMGRGALRVRVQKDGTDVDLVTCHLKSKVLSFPAADGKTAFDTNDEALRARYGAYALFRRAAEASTVRCYANQPLDGRGAERCVIALGDLNDDVSAATTQILLGPPGSQFGTDGFGHPDHGEGMRLWDLAPLGYRPDLVRQLCRRHV